MRPLTCALFSRFEVYVGKKQAHHGVSEDAKTGAAAVVRNMRVVLEGVDTGHHIVCIDRFYSSVILAIALLTMNVYVIGTCMTNRLGYDKGVVDRRKTRPANVDRGVHTVSRSKDIPSMMCTMWMDSKPVHFLSTGAVATETTVNRRSKNGPPTLVKCPQVVADYHKWMGGVDVHDQLRLQRYSIQLAVVSRKYYKGLFLGLIDMAIVNAFITHKEHMRLEGKRPMLRPEFMAVLHNQLLQVNAASFHNVEDLLLSPVPTPTARSKRARPTDHTPTQMNDWVVVSGVQKRRQRACKVCALLRGDKKKSYQTTFYCEACSLDSAKMYMCNKIRRSNKTCFQIWHDDFDMGRALPSGHRVQMRRPSQQQPGSRKKTRRELDEEMGEEEEAEAE